MANEIIVDKVYTMGETFEHLPEHLNPSELMRLESVYLYNPFKAGFANERVNPLSLNAGQIQSSLITTHAISPPDKSIASQQLFAKLSSVMEGVKNVLLTMHRNQMAMRPKRGKKQSFGLNDIGLTITPPKRRINPPKMSAPKLKR